MTDRISDIIDSNAVYEDQEVEGEVQGDNESEPEIPEFGLDITESEDIEE
jgi:hypothetical protein